MVAVVGSGAYLRIHAHHARPFGQFRQRTGESAFRMQPGIKTFSHSEADDDLPWRNGRRLRGGVVASYSTNPTRARDICGLLLIAQKHLLNKVSIAHRKIRAD